MDVLDTVFCLSFRPSGVLRGAAAVEVSTHLKHKLVYIQYFTEKKKTKLLIRFTVLCKRFLFDVLPLHLEHDE